MLCDNESFLKTQQSQRAHAAIGIAPWHVPPRSPDLNPVEKFWAWLRKKLLALDLKDAVARRPPLGRRAYTQRVRNICATQRAQQVAAACARSLKRSCEEVVRKRGAATRG